MKIAINLSIVAAMLIPFCASTAEEARGAFDEQFVEMLVDSDVTAGLNGGDNLFKLEDYLGKFERAKVTVVQSAYAKNELKGNKLYKGKTLLISGKVGEVGEDMMHTPFIAFKDRNIISPRAYFKKSELDNLAELNKGQEVMAFCKIGRFIMGAISFDDCLLADTAIKNKIQKPIAQSIIKCFDQKCGNPTFSLAAWMAQILQDNATTKEKERLLSGKLNEKQFQSILSSALKRNGDKIPERLVKAGWTKDDIEFLKK